jgi:hypothetical protein
MEEQQRVTFDFAGDREVRYVAELPEAGDFVSHTSELWIVLRVDKEDAGPVVTCRLPTRKRA